MNLSPIEEMKEYFIDHIHLCRRFVPFKANTLSFQYDGKLIDFKIECSDFTVVQEECDVEELIKFKLIDLIPKFKVENISFEINYNREELHNVLNNKTEMIKTWLSIFLYQFDFIDSATFWPSRNLIGFGSINNYRDIHTHKETYYSKIRERENFKTLLIEKNIKESAFFDIQKQLDKQLKLGFIVNTDLQYLTLAYLHSLSYNRLEFEKLIKAK